MKLKIKSIKSHQMQKIIPIAGIILFFFTLTAVFGQGKQTDEKRTAAELLLFDQSIPANPAKIPEASMDDPKIGKSGAAADPVIWKPVDATPVERAEVVPAKNQTPVPMDEKSKGNINLKDTGSQPEPSLPSGKAMNYRTIKGSKGQPDGQKSGNNLNYRNIKGSNLQPEAESPKR
jgi:hypothetical protein